VNPKLPAGLEHAAPAKPGEVDAAGVFARRRPKSSRAWDPERLTDRPGALAGLPTEMLGELGLAPQPDALGFGSLHPALAALEDPLALVLGQSAQERDHAAPLAASGGNSL
jgi:hypothetical protein